MIAGACARDVEQVALGLVDVFEIRVVGDGLEARLEREDLVVAGGHGTELEAFGQVHRADRDAPDCAIRIAIQLSDFSDLAKTPISCGWIPSAVRASSQRANSVFALPSGTPLKSANRSAWKSV